MKKQWNIDRVNKYLEEKGIKGRQWSAPVVVFDW